MTFSPPADPPAPSLTARARDALGRHPLPLLVVAAAVLFALYAVNLANSPDFTLDEIVYSTIGRHVASDNALSYGRGPFVTHPPLFFLLTAAWVAVTGNVHSPIVTAIHSLRYLAILFVALTALGTGLLTRAVLARAAITVRMTPLLSAMTIFAASGFVLSFGRVVLLDPAAIFMGVVIMLAAFRMRDRPAVQQVCVLGALIGAGCLTKQTVIFASLAPLLAALLQRHGRQIVVQLWSVLVGGAVWMTFFLWSALQGHSSSFADQQTFSARRLLGLVQVTGVNRTTTKAGAGDAVRDTIYQYASGYVIFFGGALGLLVLLVRGRVLRRHRRDRYHGAFALAFAFGFLEYAFVAFSFAFGQGNQQLVLYSAPCSGLLVVVAVVLLLHRPTPVDEADAAPVPADAPASTAARLAAVAVAFVGLVGVGTGAATWAHYYAFGNDVGTATMGRYITATYPHCVSVNATGNATRWQAVMPGVQVTSFNNGPDAAADRVHLFLLSPKDTDNNYGNSTVALARWVVAHGVKVHQVPSRTADGISLWRVGPASAISGAASCPVKEQSISPTASAGLFGGVFGGALVVLAVVFGFSRRRASRGGGPPRHRRGTSTPPDGPGPEGGPSGGPEPLPDDRTVPPPAAPDEPYAGTGAGPGGAR